MYSKGADRGEETMGLNCNIQQRIKDWWEGGHTKTRSTVDNKKRIRNFTLNNKLTAVNTGQRAGEKVRDHAAEASLSIADPQIYDSE